MNTIIRLINIGMYVWLLVTHNWEGLFIYVVATVITIIKVITSEQK